MNIFQIFYSFFDSLWQTFKNIKENFADVSHRYAIGIAHLATLATFVFWLGGLYVPLMDLNKFNGAHDTDFNVGV